jgi:hypothetical protein
MPALTSLDVSGCPFVTDIGVAALCKVPTIKALDLSHCSITNHAMADLTQVSTLQWLALRGCEQLRDDAVITLKACPSLKHLDLDSCIKVSAAAVTSLSHKISITARHLVDLSPW